MSKPSSPAPANAGGQESSVDLRSKSTFEMSDEELRRYAVARIAEHLDFGAMLVERCDQLTNMHEGDRIQPLFAGARLLQANAKVAAALTTVFGIEQRRRTIVEHIQSPAAKKADSNLTLEERMSLALRLKMLGYMTILAKENLDPALKEAFDEAGAVPGKEDDDTFEDESGDTEKDPAPAAPAAS